MSLPTDYFHYFPDGVVDVKVSPGGENAIKLYTGAATVVVSSALFFLMLLGAPTLSEPTILFRKKREAIIEFVNGIVKPNVENSEEFYSSEKNFEDKMDSLNITNISSGIARGILIKVSKNILLMISLNPLLYWSYASIPCRYYFQILEPDVVKKQGFLFIN